MRSKTLNALRNEKIYAMYCELWQSGLREELIWPQIKERYHLEVATIYRIVLKQTKTSKSKDLQLDHEPQMPTTNADN